MFWIEPNTQNAVRMESQTEAIHTFVTFDCYIAMLYLT